jgi:predicted dehydrogenase
MERHTSPILAPFIDAEYRDKRAGARSPAPLRGGIVGYGFIAEHGHVPAYAIAGAASFQIAAVADTCPARREKARAALPTARIYDDPVALLDAERGRLDFVDVATPPCDHARIVEAALSRSFHVLCEKPLATNVEEARSMIFRARRMRRVLFPCHNYKHAPVIKAVRRILDAAQIGRVRLVTLQTFRTTHAKGVDEWRRDWRRESRFSGGGIAMDHGTHTFYLAFDWLGAYPTTITAKMSTSGEFDTEDDFACSMTFPTGSATAHLTWNAGVRKVIYTIHGERGAVRVEDDDVELALLDDGEPTRVEPAGTCDMKRERIASGWMDATHVDWFRSLFDHFAEAIRHHDFVGEETESSLRCVELISGAYASARNGSRELKLRGLPLARVA